MFKRAAIMAAALLFATACELALAPSEHTVLICWVDGDTIIRGAAPDTLACAPAPIIAAK